MGHLCDARSELSSSPEAVGTLRGVADCLCGSWQRSNRPWLLQAAGIVSWLGCTTWQDTGFARGCVLQLELCCVCGAHLA